MKKIIKLKEKIKKQIIKTFIGIALVLILKLMMAYLPEYWLFNVLEIIVGVGAVTIFISLMNELGKQDKKED